MRSQHALTCSQTLTHSGSIQGTNSKSWIHVRLSAKTTKKQVLNQNMSYFTPHYSLLDVLNSSFCSNTITHVNNEITEEIISYKKTNRLLSGFSCVEILRCLL